MAIIYKTGNFEGLSTEIKIRDAVTVRLQTCLQSGPRNSSFEKVNIFPASSFFLITIPRNILYKEVTILCTLGFNYAIYSQFLLHNILNHA